MVQEYQVSFFSTIYEIVDTNLSNSFLLDNPSIITWSNGRYLEKINKTDILWIADGNDKTLKKISSADNKVIIIVGKSGRAGYVDGDALNVMMGKPSGVVEFQGYIYPRNETYLYKPVYINLNDNLRPTSACLFANYKNYSSCENETIKFIDLEGKNLVNETSLNKFIDRRRVKLINFTEEIFNTANKMYNEKNKNDTKEENSTNAESSNSENSNQNTEDNTNTNTASDTSTNQDTNKKTNDDYIHYLFIADKDNHCIRKLDYSRAEVTTFAGTCTVKGFKDGPAGVNKLDSPDGLGIDYDGNVFIMDSGNRYIRMVTPDGYMSTLINGACFDYSLEYKIDVKNNAFSYAETKLICFKDWKKTSGDPKEHIYNEDIEQNICKSHYVLCKGVQSNMIYNRTHSLYNIMELYDYTPASVLEIFNNEATGAQKYLKT